MNKMNSVSEKKLKKSNSSYYLLLLGLFLLTIVSIMIALCAGQYDITVSDVINIALSKLKDVPKTWSDTAESVIFTLRLPRILGAILVGGALALSGAAFQGVFKNPLVAPDLLGVSSGACVGAATAILWNLGSAGIHLFAFVAGILAVALTLFIPKLLRNNSMTTLVLSGVIVKGIMDSLMGIIKYMADAETELASITYWQMGSLTKVLMGDLKTIGPVIIITGILILLLRWRINILSPGDREAKALGIHVGMVRGIIILCATLLTACAVCMCGTIGWVGLVIPHLGRMLVGPDNTKSIPVSIFLGAIFMLLIDTLARVLTTMELPLSILTGIIGAPFYICILVKQRTRLS